MIIETEKIIKLASELAHCEQKSKEAYKYWISVREQCDRGEMTYRNMIAREKSVRERLNLAIEVEVMQAPLRHNVNRTHEECWDCTLREIEPPKCEGHCAGETACDKFVREKKQ